MAPKKTTKKKTAATTAAKTGFVFADQQPSPDNFTSFSKADLAADTAITANQVIEKIPPPRVNPPVMSLSDVLPSGTLNAYSDRITFHCVGDTGGIKTPSHQFLVAQKMVEDFADPDPSARPAFFYHLGDVVYYFGQAKYYYDQFYDPYRDYPAPIFAIPGNHDAVVYKAETGNSLDAFRAQFCAPAPVHTDEAVGIARTAMTQPGVYFTLNAPFVKIIGLYSNTSEGTTEGVIADKIVGQDQKNFLIAQLQQAATDRKNGFQGAVIITVHHPPFTGSVQHTPSPTMLSDIDDACTKSGVTPDAIFSGHAHLYERYTRYVTVNGVLRQIPHVVAGTGGYPTLGGLKHGAAPPPRTPVDSSDGDGKGNRLTLENYFATTFGFLRITVSPALLSCEFVGVTDTATPGQTLDRFTLDLTQHQLTGFRHP
jgi:3',5'-cyclic AMP phosphodiesterase CpdA